MIEANEVLGRPPALTLPTCADPAHMRRERRGLLAMSRTAGAVLGPGLEQIRWVRRRSDPVVLDCDAVADVVQGCVQGSPLSHDPLVRELKSKAVLLESLQGQRAKLTSDLDCQPRIRPGRRCTGFRGTRSDVCCLGSREG